MDWTKNGWIIPVQIITSSSGSGSRCSFYVLCSSQKFRVNKCPFFSSVKSSEKHKPLLLLIGWSSVLHCIDPMALQINMHARCNSRTTYFTIMTLSLNETVYSLHNFLIVDLEVQIFFLDISLVQWKNFMLLKILYDHLFFLFLK